MERTKRKRTDCPTLLLAAKADRLVAFGGGTDTVATTTAVDTALVATLPVKNKKH